MSQEQPEITVESVLEASFQHAKACNCALDWERWISELEKDALSAIESIRKIRSLLSSIESGIGSLKRGDPCYLSDSQGCRLSEHEPVSREMHPDIQRLLDPAVGKALFKLLALIPANKKNSKK